MPPSRRSIERPASLSGVGLHTGASVEATFLPAPSGQGIVFRRLDLPGQPEIRASLSEVEAVERRTALGHGDVTIHTVEHVLAGIAAHEIDDLTVTLTGPEPPILDGSVQPYFDALATAHPVAVGGEPVVLTVQAPFTVTEDDGSRSRSSGRIRSSGGRPGVTRSRPKPLRGSWHRPAPLDSRARSPSCGPKA
jgi:UDP-3-O-acyl-N-acetylglucosamine deacetylase